MSYIINFIISLYLIFNVQIFYFKNFTDATGASQNPPPNPSRRRHPYMNRPMPTGPAPSVPPLRNAPPASGRFDREPPPRLSGDWIGKPARSIPPPPSVRPFFDSLFPIRFAPPRTLQRGVVCGRSVHWLDRIGDAIGRRFAGPDRKRNPWRGRIGSEVDAGGSAASGRSRGYIIN